MHRKPFVLKEESFNATIPQLEQFLSGVAKEGLRFVAGSYTGTGRDGLIVPLTFTPQCVIISLYGDLGLDSALFPLSSHMVFSFFVNNGVSYVPGTGLVKDAVTLISPNSMTLGVNANVNTATKTYVYLAIG